jgi:4-aminobutyrate aminotransferase-like enzyme
MSQNFSTLALAASSAADAPRIKTESPGLESRALHDRMARHGVFGGAVRLHPVAFESRLGITLTDVDSNTYLDFTSGTAVANLGHSHPKIAEAIASATRVLANVHDHATEHKARVLEASRS